MRRPSTPSARCRPSAATFDLGDEAVVENLPALVQAAARGIAGAKLTILNGTEGVNEVLVGLVGQGLSILDTLKKSTVMRPYQPPPAPGPGPGQS